MVHVKGHWVTRKRFSSKAKHTKGKSNMRYWVKPHHRKK